MEAILNRHFQSCPGAYTSCQYVSNARAVHHDITTPVVIIPSTARDTINLNRHFQSCPGVYTSCQYVSVACTLHHDITTPVVIIPSTALDTVNLNQHLQSCLVVLQNGTTIEESSRVCSRISLSNLQSDRRGCLKQRCELPPQVFFQGD